MTISDREAIVKWLKAVTARPTKSIPLSRVMALRMIDLLERKNAA